jgi:hypothetical protein
MPRTLLGRGPPARLDLEDDFRRGTTHSKGRVLSTRNCSRIAQVGPQGPPAPLRVAAREGRSATGGGSLLWSTWTIRSAAVKRSRQTKHQQITTDSGRRRQPAPPKGIVPILRSVLAADRSPSQTGGKVVARRFPERWVAATDELNRPMFMICTEVWAAAQGA